MNLKGSANRRDYSYLQAIMLSWPYTLESADHEESQNLITHGFFSVNPQVASTEKRTSKLAT